MSWYTTLGDDSRKVKLYQVEPPPQQMGGRRKAAESDVLDRGEVEGVDGEFNLVQLVYEIVIFFCYSKLRI